MLIFAVAAALALTNTVRRPPPNPSVLLLPELVFLLGFLAVMLIRLDRPEILYTEKFMNLGVLTSLLRTEVFPPPDFWLGGETLPYYYWGALPWVIPLGLLGIGAGVGYNLVAATLGGMIAALAWSIGRGLSGRIFGGVMAALLCVAAGTADGFRQFAGTHSLAAVEIWKSSRQAANVITEFPLFTLWLGDLHPHLLSVPLVLLVLLIALQRTHVEPAPVRIVIPAALTGLVAAANPWAYPSTMLAVLLLSLCGGKRLRTGRSRWLDAVAILLVFGAVSWFAVLPFHVHYSAPFLGLGWVHQGTPVTALLLYAGVLLVPVVGYALQRIRESWRIPETGGLIVLSGSALIVLVAAVSGRPTPVLLGILLVALVFAARREPPGRDRSAVLLAATGVFLLFVPEILFVRDSYGDAYYRLNTVFKSYFQAWLLLSLAVPALLCNWLPRALPRYALAAILAVVALAHPAGLVARFKSENIGMDGYAWMTASDRAIVEYLRRLPHDAVILEAVGEAYGESARISAASGVPAYLGWLNHEMVWRGASITPELDRRATVAARVYSETDPKIIAGLVQREGIDFVVVGSLERMRYSAQALRAIENAGRVVFEDQDSRLVRFP
jgi:YYY domain-containing protein